MGWGQVKDSRPALRIVTGIWECLLVWDVVIYVVYMYETITYSLNTRI